MISMHLCTLDLQQKPFKVPHDSATIINFILKLVYISIYFEAGDSWEIFVR